MSDLETRQILVECAAALGIAEADGCGSCADDMAEQLGNVRYACSLLPAFYAECFKRQDMKPWAYLWCMISNTAPGCWPEDITDAVRRVKERGE